jgi:hypothetical protein
VSSITIDEKYTVSQHGLEWFNGTTLELYAEIRYGANLKDKLRRDVVTVSPQNLTPGQKSTARTNIGAGSAADVATNAENITAQSQNIQKLSDAMTYVVSGNKSVETASIPIGSFVRLVNSSIAGRADGIYTAKKAIPVAPDTIDDTYLNETAPISGGVGNALNSNITTINSKIGNIGTIVTGTNASSLVVEKSTYVNICSMTISAGTWVIVGGHRWTESFADLCICRLLAGSSGIDGTTVRYAVDNGGGINITGIYKATSSTSIKLSVYQTSSSSKTAEGVSLKAVRIA